MQEFFFDAVPSSETASVRVTSFHNTIKHDINICKDVQAHLVLSSGPTVLLWASSAPVTRKCCDMDGDIYIRSVSVSRLVSALVHGGIVGVSSSVDGDHGGWSTRR